MKIETALLSGAGNTFHLINDQGELKNHDKKWKMEFGQMICKANPADGVIFLSSATTKPDTFDWVFFNNDGSDAEMCGNATRCVGYYIKNILGDGGSDWYLNTTAGRIHIHSLPNNQFEINMTAIAALKSSHGFFCNTGVPHLVIEIDNFNNYKNLKTEAQKLRRHIDFLPGGTNVTYVSRTQQKNHIQAVSFERGVEDFTEACGTGAMAAAFYYFKKTGVTKTEVEMPGGMLMMDVSNPEKPIMIGPALLLGKYIYEV